MAIKPINAQKRLGKVIRDRRTELGYSQEMFATVCDLHRTYMGAVERGERNISLKNIIKVSAALKISASDLFELASL